MDYAFTWMLMNTVMGLSLVIIGAIAAKKPPKKINTMYGYRTKLAMSTQEHWDRAQALSGPMIVKQGLFLMLLGVAGFFTPRVSELGEVVLSMLLLGGVVYYGFWKIEGELRKI